MDRIIAADWLNPRPDGRQAFYEIGAVRDKGGDRFEVDVISHNDAPLAPGRISVQFLWWVKTIETAGRPLGLIRSQAGVMIACEASPTYLVGFPGATGMPDA